MRKEWPWGGEKDGDGVEEGERGRKHQAQEDLRKGEKLAQRRQTRKTTSGNAKREGRAVEEAL